MKIAANFLQHNFKQVSRSIVVSCLCMQLYACTAVLPPLIYNAYQDSTELGSFTCVTRNSDDIRWIVDGYAHNDPSLRDKIFVYTESYANRSQHSVIRIPAIPANNRIAEIECRAYSNEPWEVAYSAHTAQFNIQGLLDMPPNATYSSYNATHYLVEWMQPQTLDISNVEPDIENYTACTYKNNVDPECANTTTARLFLPKYFFDQFLFLTVWNVVGESNSSAQLVIERCNINDKFSMAGGMSMHFKLVEFMIRCMVTFLIR